MTGNTERRFEMELRIDAEPGRVWDALATAAGLSSWFANEAKVDGREGGAISWRWGDAYAWPQTIVEWRPGERLLTRYDSTVDDGAGGKRPLFVDFRLEGKSGSTLLRIVQSGFGPEADFDAEYDGISHGWPGEARILRHWVERHAPRPRRLGCLQRVVDRPFIEVWELLCGPSGLGCGAGIAGLSEGIAFDLVLPSVGARRAIQMDGECTAVLRESTARLPDLDEAVLRFWSRDLGGKTEIWIWLEDWRGDEGRCAGFAAATEKMVEALLSPTAQGAGA